MSGVKDFIFSKPALQGPIEKKLALEDNRRIVRSIGAGQVAGAWFIAWALTISFTIPLPPPEAVEVDTPPIVLKLPEDGYHSKTRKKPRESLREHTNRGRVAQAPKPAKETGVIRQNLVEARTDKLLGKAFEMIKSIGHGIDQEKIERAGGLTRTDPTRLSGRQGVKREGFNPGYGTGTGETEEIDVDATRIRGPIETDGSRLSGMGKATQITVGSEERFRSSDEILAVVRSHTPGLRHLYNTHLKQTPGMSGKVTVRFAISPSGQVVDAAIASGTTGSRAFEEQVLRKIMAWRFDSIKAVGNDLVTVPFNFSE